MSVCVSGRRRPKLLSRGKDAANDDCVVDNAGRPAAILAERLFSSSRETERNPRAANLIILRSAAGSVSSVLSLCVCVHKQDQMRNLCVLQVFCC